MVASAPIHAFLEFFLTSTLHNILSKPLAAFPHSQCASAPIHAFLEFFLTSTLHNILSKPLSHIANVETTDDDERGMNPVAMTIINPRIKPATSCSQVGKAIN